MTDVRPAEHRPTAAPGLLQTATEGRIGPHIVDVFERSHDSLKVRLPTFPRYARRAQITRFLALYELFKLVLPVNGSVVESGVFWGFSLMTWAKLSPVFEPNSLTRRVYGFDTFRWFPSVSATDGSERNGAAPGDLAASTKIELEQLIEIFDDDRFLGHLPKVKLIEGDLANTPSMFLRATPHLLVSLLFLDVDLYEPTKMALELLLPRMPPGAVVAFDELDNPLWPAETEAAIEAVGLNRLEFRRLEFEPYIAFAP